MEQIVTSSWFMFALVALLAAVLVFGLKMAYRFKPVRITQEKIGVDGYRVAVAVTYRGLKNNRFFAIGHNNLYPKFVLFQDYIAFTVVFPTQKRLSDIELVDIFRTIATANVIIHFKDNPFTFSANTVNQDRLKAVVQFFKDKNIPLSPRAEEFLRTSV